jgi:hypothetical protein
MDGVNGSGDEHAWGNPRSEDWAGGLIARILCVGGKPGGGEPFGTLPRL